MNRITSSEFIKKLLNLAPVKRVRASLFIQRVSLTLVTRGILLVISFLISIITARYLGPEGRGIYAVTGAIAAMGVQFGNFGLHAANTYFVARDRNLLGKVVGNSIWISIIGGLFIGFLVTGFFYVYPQLVGGVRVLYIAIAALSIPFGLLFLLGENLILGIQSIKVLNGIYLAHGIVTVLAVTVLLVLLNLDVLSVVIMGVVIVFVFGGVALFYLGTVKKPQLTFDLNLFKQMAGYGLKAYLAALFLYLSMRLNTLMVNYFAGTEQAGIYSIASSTGEMLYMIPTSIGMILFPQVTGMKTGGWEYSRKVAVGTGAIMAVVCVVVGLIASPFMRIFYGQEFVSAAGALIWLLPGIFFYSVNTIFMQHFAARGLPKVVILSPFIALLATFLLNLYFIPHYGMNGASMVMSIAYVLMFLFSIIYLKVNTDVRR